MVAVEETVAVASAEKLAAASPHGLLWQWVPPPTPGAARGRGLPSPASGWLLRAPSFSQGSLAWCGVQPVGDSTLAVPGLLFLPPPPPGQHLHSHLGFWLYILEGLKGSLPLAYMSVRCRPMLLFSSSPQLLSCLGTVPCPES